MVLGTLILDSAKTNGRDVVRATTSAELLTARELGAWRGLLRVHAALTAELSAELQEAHGLSLSEYEVLLDLSLREGHRMRMSELARAALLTPSGITRLVERLERRGLVERCPCADDRRGSAARLTDDGAAAFVAAQRDHLEAVRRHFLHHFDDVEQDTLAALWDRVLPGASGRGGTAQARDGVE